MLSIKNLHKRYGAATAVNGVTVDIPEGQMVGIIGRSGAGKSTLLRLINRLTDASEEIGAKALQAAVKAEDYCLISQALQGNVTITVEPELAS